MAADSGAESSGEFTRQMRGCNSGVRYAVFCRSGFSRELFLPNRDITAILGKSSRLKPLLQKRNHGAGRRDA